MVFLVRCSRLGRHVRMQYVRYVCAFFVIQIGLWILHLLGQALTTLADDCSAAFTEVLAEVLRNRFQRFVECESFACLEGGQVPDLRFSVGPRHVCSKSHATFTVPHETMATQTSLIRNRTNVRRCSKLLVTPHGSYTCLGLVVSAEILAMFWGIVAAPFGN